MSLWIRCQDELQQTIRQQRFVPDPSRRQDPGSSQSVIWSTFAPSHARRRRDLGGCWLVLSFEMVLIWSERLSYLLVAVFNFGFTSSNHHPPAAILNAITILILNHILKRQKILSFQIQNGCKKWSWPRRHKVSSDAMRVCGHDRVSSWHIECPSNRHDHVFSWHSVLQKDTLRQTWPCVFLAYLVSFKQTLPCVQSLSSTWMFLFFWWFCFTSQYLYPFINYKNLNAIFFSHLTFPPWPCFCWKWRRIG